MTKVSFKGAKGSSGSFTQTPDNLRSNDTFEGVLGMGIGPMKGPTNGLKSIKLDGTAIENETGEQNFADFVATIGTGDPAQFPQQIQLKLGAGATPTNIGVSLLNPQTDGHSPGVWTTKTMNNTNADFVDLRFIVSQLARQDSKGIYDLTATLDIQLKPVGSTTWINPTIGASAPVPSEDYTDFPIDDGYGIKTFVPSGYLTREYGRQNFPITGKTTSPAVYELRLALPNTGAYANTGWDIRVRLEERDTFDDGNGNTEKRSIQWESLAAVYGSVLGVQEDWRGVAWLQLYGKASDQLTGVPEVTGEWDTKIVSVPASNIYNPDTRQYTNGLWDGSWTKAYTNDPAWVINDAISDSLSGLSLIARGSYLNKWDALDASKWCSTLVPDGAGGTHPRYSINIAVTEPQKAEEFVRYLAGAIGGLAWDEGDGQWRMKIDKPEAAVDLFTLDNVEGEFVYSNTDVDTRFNDITGTFLNAEMDYRQDRVRLYDNSSIALIGQKPTTVALVGCTNRQEALRRVKLRLRSTVNEKRIVNFTTNRRGRNVNALDLILIADGDLADSTKKTQGRMSLDNGNQQKIVFRDPIYLPSGTSYTINYSVPNPNYNPDAVAQPGSDWTKPTIVVSALVGTNLANYDQSVYTLYIDSSTPLPADLPNNTSFAVNAPNLPAMPKLFRVTNVAIGDDGERISIAALEVDSGKWDASDNVSNIDTVFQDLRGPVPVPLAPIDGNLLSIVKIPIQQGFQTSLVANWIRPAGAYVSGFDVKYRINGGAWQNPQTNLQTATFELVDPTPGYYEFAISTVDRRGGLSDPLSAFMTVTQDILNAAQIYYNTPVGVPAISVQNYMPSQAGADVTAFNTSANTNSVGGRPSGTVLSQLDAGGALLDTTPPSVPTNFALTSQIATDTDGSQIVTLIGTWTASTAKNGLAGYTIAIKQGSGNYVYLSIPPDATSFRQVVGANTTFTAQIQAIDNNNNRSAYSSLITYTTIKDTVPPAAPTGFTVTAGFSQLYLSWTAPADLDTASMFLYEGTTNSFAASTLIQTLNALPGKSGGTSRTLATGQTRYYWLAAVDTSGNLSTVAGPVSGTTANLSNADVTPGLVIPKASISALTDPGVTGQTSTYNGRIVTYSNGAWNYSVIDTSSLVGQVSSAQISGIVASQLSGVLSTSNIPGLDASKITSGTFGDALLSAISATKITGQLADSQIASIVASKVSGVLATTNIPGLDASKITSGTFGDSVLAAISATKITGQLTDSQISSLVASKISGTLATTNIPGLDVSKITSGTFGTSFIPGLDASKIVSGTLAAAQIGSGTIDYTKLASGLAAPRIITGVSNVNGGSVTSTRANDIIYNVTDGKLYRNPTSGATTGWVAMAVGTGDLVGQIAASQIVANSITSGQIAAATITSTQIASNTIVAGNLVAGTITSNEIAASTIKASNIAARTIVAGNLVAGTVTSNEIAANTIVASNIAAGTITGDRLLANTITATQIASSTITATQIAAGTIVAANIASGTITATQLAASSVTATQLAAGSVTANAIAANTITAGQIASSTITSTQIAAGTILASNILAGTITGDRLAANTITALQIAANTITASQIAASTITAAQIASNTITSNNIAAGAITTAQLAAGAITASKIGITGASLFPDGQMQDYGFWTSTATNTVTGQGYAVPTGAFYIDTSSNASVVASKGSLNAWVTLSSVVNGYTGNLVQLFAPSVGGIIGGETYELKCTLFNSSNRPTFIAYMQLYKADGTYISTTQLGATVPNDGISRAISGQILAPAGAAFYRLYWEAAGSTSGFTGQLYIGGITVRQANSGTMIIDGSLTAQKIAVGTITADRIAAGTITGDRISSTTSLPGSITVGTTGFTLSTIQTDTAGGTPGGNRVPYSNMEAGLASVDYYSGAPAAGITNYGVSAGINYVNVQFNNLPANSYAAILSKSFHVTPGERISYQIALGGYGTITGTQQTELIYFDGTGATVLERQGQAYAPSAGGLAFPTVVGNFDTVPANARTAVVRVLLFNIGACSPGLTFAQPMVASASAGQTILPAYQPSGNSPDAATTINGNTTQINAGKVLIAGGTSLSDWRNGGDNTKIDGGSIAANTISANKITIGARGITVQDMNFQANPANNTCSWSGGGILYTNDDGTQAFQGISPGSCTFSGYYVHLYWIKGTGSLSSTTDWVSILSNPNAVHMGIYEGGALFIADYGATIIDGTRITTGSITATQIAAGSITSDRLTIGQGNNLIYGAAQVLGPDGTGNFYNFTGNSISYGRNYGDTNYTLSDGSTYWLYQAGTGNGNSFFVYKKLNDTNGNTDEQFDIIPNARYEFSVYMMTHRCTSGCYIEWYDSAGNGKGTSYSNYGGPDDHGAKSLDLYRRSVVIANAPSGASKARLVLQKGPTLSGTDSFMFWVRPMFAQASSLYQTEASPWSAGSSTFIDGAGIRTNSINAQSITAGTITTDRLVDKSVTQSFVLASGNTLYGTYSGGSAGSGGTTTGGGSSGGGGPGNYCPEPVTPILLANDSHDGPGDYILAGDLTLDHFVWTQHEMTMEWGAYQVIQARHFIGDLWKAEGLYRATKGHPFYIDNSWITIDAIGAFDQKGEAVAISIEKARTFVSKKLDGSMILNHNVKQLQ